jgi:hypothetical protein
MRIIASTPCQDFSGGNLRKCVAEGVVSSLLIRISEFFGTNVRGTAQAFHVKDKL